LRHGTAADVAVADEEYFYHCCITSHFLVFLGISLFLGHLRTFSVCRPFSHFSAFFGISRYVSSTKWSKYWSKLDYFSKFRPLVFSGLFVEQKIHKSVDYVRFFLLFSIFGKCYETFTDHQWLKNVKKTFSSDYLNAFINFSFRPFLDHCLAAHQRFQPVIVVIPAFGNCQ